MPSGVVSVCALKLPTRLLTEFVHIDLSDEKATRIWMLSHFFLRHVFGGRGEQQLDLAADSEELGAGDLW